jgi:hypothetical protein
MNNVLEDFFKLKMPLTREVFFKQSIVLLIIQTLLALFMTYAMFVFRKPWQFILILVLVIGFEIPVLSSYFVLSTRRIWNLTGELQKSLLINVVLFALSFMPPVLIGVYLFLILKSGEYVGEQN